MIGIKILLEAGECNGFFDMAVQDHLGNILSDPKLHSGTNTVEFRFLLSFYRLYYAIDASEWKAEIQPITAIPGKSNLLSSIISIRFPKFKK